MSRRADILQRIRAALPDPVELPDDPGKFHSNTSPEDRSLIESWSKQARAAGSEVHCVPDLTTVHEWIRARTWTGPLASTIPKLNEDPAFSDMPATTDAMAKTDLLVVESPLGVAENGAVWISDETGAPRAFPFLCREMAVVLPANRIVPNLHDAYRELGSGPVRWGLFIGAPSKTADIEQSLVVGAHGPEALTLFLLDS
ncbi:MAG: LutC/YkgG family protein [Bacteroidota bacterium]